MDSKEEDIFGGVIYRHWSYISKGRAIRDFLGDIRVKETLDVGAGSGVFSRQLLDHGYCSSAVCVDPFYETEKMDMHNGKPIKFVKSVSAVSQNLILVLDVLQNVEDDVALLQQFVEPMPQGGQVLITVPAFPFLWSGYDVSLGHKRRYTAKMLERTIYKAGLEPTKTRFFFGALFPFTAALRATRNLFVNRNDVQAKNVSDCPKWMNNALVGVCDAERKTLFHINKVAGLTLFCLCKK